MAYLQVKNIVKSFNGTRILKGISFEMEKGEVLSIIGSSGSGKTTLLRAITLLGEADKGYVNVDGVETFNSNAEKIKGRNAQEEDLREKRLNFGLVFQSFNLFPQYTALQNITLPLELLNKDRVKKGLTPICDDEKKEAEMLLCKMGLEKKMDKYPCNLSGGQQQRVAIARAMALKPKILCFDEPTSALDPELANEVLKAIRDLKEQGLTMIIVTHEMEFAKNISDRVLFLSDGRVEEEGTPEQVFNNPQSEVTKNFIKSYSQRD